MLPEPSFHVVFPFPYDSKFETNSRKCENIIKVLKRYGVECFVWMDRKPPPRFITNQGRCFGFNGEDILLDNQINDHDSIICYQVYDNETFVQTEDLEDIALSSFFIYDLHYPEHMAVPEIRKRIEMIVDSFPSNQTASKLA